MDPSAPAAVPWVVLAVALLSLAGLAAVALTGRWGTAPAPDVPPRPAPVRPAPRWADDDLPGFLEAPPGTPGDPPGPAAGPAADAAGTAPAGPDGTGRAVAGAAAVALVLVAALAGVAVATRDGGDPPAQAAPGSPASSPGPGPTTPAPTALPAVPADPLPGEGGAGVLADRSVPLGGDGVLARLAFGGIVVEREAVGTTVAYPAVSVTAAGDGGTALAHLRLPTWNCLTPEPPADPAAAGCVRSRTEYADLPTPALTVTREGRDLRLSGRFPTYTRPIGTAPAYTGRAYDLAVTVSPAGPVRDGSARAEGTLFLGTDRAENIDEPALGVVRYAG